MNKYVLWLASWYPSSVDPFNGDFIERHAKAVSAFIPIKLIYVVKDPSLKPGEVKLENQEDDRLSVFRAYYNTKPGILGKLSSFRKYISLHKKIFSDLTSRFGLPALVHVHVAFKAGLFAQYLHRKHGIPCVISEHWSGYYSDNAVQNVYDMPVQKWLTERILNRAGYILPVSASLGDAISELSDTKQVIVPNVVDTSLFYEGGQAPQEPVFVHISNMAAVKNAEGILRAAVKLHEEGCRFKLMMVGAAPEPLMDLARAFGALENYVFFTEAVPYRQVPDYLQGATALVLFSHFETQSCVALEALCCGVPVIAAAVGGLPEVINASNGILVKRGDEKELKEAMRTMANLEDVFNRSTIAAGAREHFGYERVAQQIIEVYDEVADCTVHQPE